MINLVFMVAITDTVYYIVCGILAVIVLTGIYLMSKVKTAAFGNFLSALAIAFGIVLTLVKYDIIPVWILYIGIAVGFLIGYYLAVRVKMIEMPQLVAFLNGVGGAASAIVGFFAYLGIGTDSDLFSKITALLAIAVGTVTFFGSMVAAGKLHKLISQKPIILPFHTIITVGLFSVLIASIIFGTFSGHNTIPSLNAVALVVIAALFGLVFTVRVGGADMPITISLLNSLSGVAGAIAGLAIKDVLLVAVGGIVGASGLLLTQIMCKAMNRRLWTILLGKTTAIRKSQVSALPQTDLEESSTAVPITVLKTAKKVIIVPGYGMALAQAQHLVKALADRLSENGAAVKYAIHPVAGRMPGHMNVLLCEADVDYEDLYEMADINNEFAAADLTIIVGANDVVNPAARDTDGTPISGMPILNADHCPNIVIFNYDLKPGYAGVDNPLYKRKEGVWLALGDAAVTIKNLLEKW
ncbi:MAG: NAD(P)(+) transhydrogenase (Re/Si-specific) subunit beta [Bacilli bacterium]|nr:NAD(P)(+) transhydrogenase (Re/Si-specific) subunit beta [Bacilli bacterium]MDD4077330.1 NAD(P)(+) transhydrogenase (Re/Si-specific) subunit beta [Bacilli bacterium]MDD4388551.1 NAD(P)(+) transhydrogenase (Re/Si-specific) subunit beta [Bacilli bacterium]